jgi:hypothetical protein
VPTNRDAIGFRIRRRPWDSAKATVNETVALYKVELVDAEKSTGQKMTGGPQARGGGQIVCHLLTLSVRWRRLQRLILSPPR